MALALCQRVLGADAGGPEQTKRVQRLTTQMVATQSYEIGVFDHLLATTYS